MRLIPIEIDGSIREKHVLLPVAIDACMINKKHFAQVGYVKPWIAYLAEVDSKIVGTCAFKYAPIDGKTEIAYFTFPFYENRGHATAMAQSLIELAAKTDEQVRVIAQTLATPNASTYILTKLGFTKTRDIFDEEDGAVWEWELKKENL